MDKKLLNKWIRQITFIEDAYDDPTLKVHNDSLLIKHDEAGHHHIGVAGSNGNWTDWVGSRGNFTITQDKIPDVGKTATRGFVNAALACFQEIERRFNITTSVHISGHSRGGPIASILACLIHSRLGIQDIELTTFGSPKFTTDKSFNDFEFMKTSSRVVSIGDTVTDMPGHVRGFLRKAPMVHLGKEYRIGNEKHRHMLKLMDNYDAHMISMYKSICYDLERSASE